MRRLLPAWFKDAIRPVAYALKCPFDNLYCALHGVTWHHGWVLRGWPLFRTVSYSHIIIGQRFVAVSKSRYNSVGIFQPVILTAYGNASIIQIGDDVGMSGCSVTALQRVTIGNRVLIGSGALITDNDAHPICADGRRYSHDIYTAPVDIGDDVFIGARAIVLKGVTIARGAIIGAGSVVVKNVPEFAIVAGNPATVIGYTTNAKVFP